MTEPNQDVAIQEPVRIKLYGLFSVTRRGYLTQLIVTGVLLVIWLIWWSKAVPPEDKMAPRPANPPAYYDLMRFVVLHVPWIVLVLGLLLALEAYIILRRFARAEALRRGQPPKSSPNP